MQLAVGNNTYLFVIRPQSQLSVLSSKFFPLTLFVPIRNSYPISILSSQFSRAGMCAPLSAGA